MTSPSQLDAIVQHTYHHVRRGEKVIAVVSAFAGETDRLLELSQAQVNDPDPGCVAAIAETGELYSAARLGLALDRAGVSVHVLHAGAIGLQAEGALLDATPTRLDVQAVHAALDTASVLVVPGFVGRTATGRTCLLGRGGSDLTAIFLATELEAEHCVLVKDVDGLFDRDPATDPTRAVRFDAVTFEEALSLDDAIVQHKAVRYARSRNRQFEVAGLLRPSGTCVGDAQTQTSAAKATPSVLRVALLGCGTVGDCVREAIGSLGSIARVVSITTRRSEGVDPSLYVPIEALKTSAYDILIEATGAMDVGPVLHAALKAGRTVISANKALLATHGLALQSCANRHGGRLLYGASTGGSLPLLEVAACRPGLQRVDAILNGSTNFVIDRIAQGWSVERAIAKAVQDGLCEADPWRDLAGQDAADKLVVLHNTLAANVPLQVHVPTQAQAKEALASVASDRGQLRQVAVWARTPDGATATVAFESLAETHPLAGARCEENIALMHWPDFPSVTIRGRGAGRWPTTLAVIGDVLQVALEASCAVPSST
jgi:homoserine dehydrogenase